MSSVKLVADDTVFYTINLTTCHAFYRLQVAFNDLQITQFKNVNGPSPTHAFTGHLNHTVQCYTCLEIWQIDEHVAKKLYCIYVTLEAENPNCIKPNISDFITLIL